MRPPKNQILENLYTKGNEYILSKTYDNYVGYYHSVSGKYYIGATYNSNAIQLVPYTEKREAAAYNLTQIDPIYMRNNPNIVNIIKKGLLFNPTVCAIGDGYKDTEMMKNADISIELVKICNKKNDKHTIIFGHRCDNFTI